MVGPKLKGNKVVLKPMGLEDAPNFVEWFKDKEITKFLGNQNKDLDLKKERAYIRGLSKKKEQITWSIYTKDGIHIGSTDLHSLNKEHKKTEFGIMIGDKNYWNKGLGQDTLKTVIKYCFNTLKLNRFELIVFSDNSKALKCYTNCGLRLEGTKRQAVYRDGKYWDEIIMSLLKSEYKKLKNK